MREFFGLDAVSLTKYIFFTGKGGVGKTSISSAVSVALADGGKRVLLVSTDPASNLQDVFDTELSGDGVPIKDVPGLVVANLNPEEAAAAYREKVIGPYRGKLPDSMIARMEETLSGSCTVEIAAFDRFSRFITDEGVSLSYDHIVFDTAPTGHTLRLLALPSAWTDFIGKSEHGASCLGQLAGLNEKKDMYKFAVENLSDSEKTTIVLVARPDESSLAEAARSSGELSELGVANQFLVVNGLLEEKNDEISARISSRQALALETMPERLKEMDRYFVPLRSYDILGAEQIRAFLSREIPPKGSGAACVPRFRQFEEFVESMRSKDKKIILTMGKGGVGKTTAAVAIASALARNGVRVRLVSTDPAGDLESVAVDGGNIKISKIDEKQELENYRLEVLAKAREIMNEDDLDYIEEDLRSPCTQEIAVFRAFANIVGRFPDETAVIDTAPTGHTLLLLDATQSYHREVQRAKGEIPPSVAALLPRLRDPAVTEAVIVALPEATPVMEASRLKDDLARAGIKNTWWIANRCLSLVETDNPILSARAESEKCWLAKISKISAGNMVAVPWLDDVSPWFRAGICRSAASILSR
jgi:arsenite-transporting ATPase